MIDPISSVVSLFAMGVSAISAAQPPLGLSGNEPIDVSAEECEILAGGDTVSCTGNVRVSQGEAVLTAEKMKIFGTSSEEGFSRIEGEGAVRYASGINAVSGNRATYDGASTTITMVGDVVVVQGDQVMVGGKLVYNTTTQAMVFTPGQDGRVRGVFNSEAEAGQ